MTTPAKTRASVQVQTADASGDLTRTVRTGARLPHERDQSTRQPATAPARVMKVAHDDVEKGLVDTDTRGDDARRVFDHRTRGEGIASPATRPRRKRRPS